MTATAIAPVVPRPKGADPELWKLVCYLYERGSRSTSGMTVALNLAAEEGAIRRAAIPEEYTVRRWVNKLNAFYESEPVGLADIPVEHSRYVLGVLATVVEVSQGKVQQLSRHEVEWIIRVHAAAPDLDHWQVFQYARLYWGYTNLQKPTIDLDLTLAFAPWSDSAAMERLTAALFAGWLPVGSYRTFGDADNLRHSAHGVAPASVAPKKVLNQEETLALLEKLQ